jgi:AcrR family transcriptional regulator
MRRQRGGDTEQAQKLAGNARETSRRRQLVEIAYRQIVARGFEGLRFREVAAEAGINNATLAYYFPTKEALIQGVTELLGERLQTSQTRSDEPAPRNALAELRQMFEGLRRRLAEDPSFFIVITELALRARRDRAVASMGEQRDRFWERRLTRILTRGMEEGVFRADLEVPGAVLALMAQMKGIAQHAAMRERPAAEIAALVETVAEQVEMWVRAKGSR